MIRLISRWRTRRTPPTPSPGPAIQAAEHRAARQRLLALARNSSDYRYGR